MPKPRKQMATFPARLDLHLRSPQWPRVEKAWLREHGDCAVCGATVHLQVHHVVPFHVDPALELDVGNLMTLCLPHHFFCAHLMNWRSFNKDILADAAIWREKIRCRPHSTAEASP